MTRLPSRLQLMFGTLQQHFAAAVPHHSMARLRLRGDTEVATMTVCSTYTMPQQR